MAPFKVMLSLSKSEIEYPHPHTHDLDLKKFPRTIVRLPLSSFALGNSSSSLFLPSPSSTPPLPPHLHHTRLIPVSQAAYQVTMILFPLHAANINIHMKIHQSLLPIDLLVPLPRPTCHNCFCNQEDKENVHSFLCIRFHADKGTSALLLQ